VIATSDMGEISAPLDGEREVFDAELGRFVRASLISRSALRPGSTFMGPALIVEDQTTTHVPIGFAGHVSAHRHLVLKRITS
jgi:N-methylhydantoinase A